MNVHVGDGVAHQRRRIHFQHAALGEERARIAQHLRPHLEIGGGSGRTPVHAGSPIPWPTASGIPGASARSQLVILAGNSITMVEPMLKRANSAPRGWLKCALPL